MISLAIPLLDLSALDGGDAEARAGLAASIAAAGSELGVFLVRGHGVAAREIDAQFALARAFFALPLAEKARIDVAHGPAFRGYEALGSQTIDPDAPGDGKEGFIMGPDLPDDHPHVLAGYPNTGTNVWPRQLPGLREATERWVARMGDVARLVARGFAASLGLVDGAFAASLAAPLVYAQLFHYPSLGADASLGAGAHRDYGFLTVLAQDGPGLEVRIGEAWVPVPFEPYAFVVIFGEAVVRLTNGRYRSPLHRVAANRSGRSRYTLPTFVDFPYDRTIGPLAPCIGPEGPRFGVVTVAEHLRAMRTRTLSDALRADYQSVPPPTRM